MNSIIETLGPNSNYWAFTGSVALWYHSVRAGVEPREPHDIDILIDKSAKTYVIAALGSLGWVPQSEGSARITFKKGHKHLDVIFAGSRLGPSLSSVVKVPGGPPIVSLNALLNRKKQITPNAKTRQNISRLRNLGAKTPVRRVNRREGRKLFN